MQKEVRDDIVAVILACVCSAAGFLPVYLSTDNPGTSSFSRFASCVPTTVLLSVYLLGLPRLLSDRSKQVVGGSPRYSYLISFAHQACSLHRAPAPASPQPNRTPLLPIVASRP